MRDRAWPAGAEQVPPEPFDDDELDSEPGGELEVQPFALPLALEETRAVREPSRTVAENIAFARHAAYALPTGLWRTANVLYVSTLGAAMKVVLRSLDWALVDGGLGRALLALPVLAALAFFANRVPVLAWLVPDQLDVTSWLPQPSPEMVEVPIVAPGSAR